MNWRGEGGQTLSYFFSSKEKDGCPARVRIKEEKGSEKERENR